MPAISLSHIPCEVTDLILDHVCEKDGSKEDFKALSACGLVCRYLNTLVCPRLFERIQINDEWGYGMATKALKRIETLRELIETSPALGTFVHSFVITTHLVGYPDYHGHAWILHNTQIPVILPLLTRLRLFSFQNLTGTVVWKYLSPEMSKALQDICLKPSITHLQLSNIRGIPAGWIARCCNLDNIHLKYVSGDPGVDDLYRSDRPHTPSSVTSIDVLNATSAMEALNQYSSFSNLKKLKVALHQEGDVEITRRVLKDAQCTLEELEISSVIRSWGPLAPTFELHTLSALETIKINSVLYIIDSHTLPDAIPTLLELPEPSHSVETIQLRFEWGGARSVADGPLVLYLHSGWTRLDEIIKTTYPELKKLVLEFQDENWNLVKAGEREGDGEEEEKAKEHLSSVLSALSQSKSMTLQLVVLPCMAIYEL